MAKKEDSVLKMVVVLMVTCIFSGVALAYTYNLTKDKIAQTEKEAGLSAVKKVLPVYDGIPQEKIINIDGVEKSIYIGKKDGKIVGFAIPSGAIGYGGMVNILVGIDTNGKVTGMELLAHQETPGLGSKAGEAKFKDQFKGKFLKSVSEVFSVRKDGGDIEAITAATITSRAVTNGVTEALRIYLKNKEQLV